MCAVEQGNPAAFVLRRGPVGCLLLHGFPSSPAEMRPLGQYLAQHNISVFAPLLPGFGTIPEDLRGVRWLDWVAAGEAGFQHLERYCSTVVLCGLSMGGTLALFLSVHLPVAGVVAMAPAIRVRDRRFEWAHLLRVFYRWVGSGSQTQPGSSAQVRPPVWHYRRYPPNAVVQFRTLVRATRRALPRVRLPTLILQGRLDGSLDPEGARLVDDRISAKDKTLVWLEHSRHNLAVGVEREQAFEQVHAFIERVAGLRDA
jgi:carboxylesterase